MVRLHKCYRCPQRAHRLGVQNYSSNFLKLYTRDPDAQGWRNSGQATVDTVSVGAEHARINAASSAREMPSSVSPSRRRNTSSISRGVKVSVSAGSPKKTATVGSRRTCVAVNRGLDQVHLPLVRGISINTTERQAGVPKIFACVWQNTDTPSTQWKAKLNRTG